MDITIWVAVDDLGNWCEAQDEDSLDIGDLEGKAVQTYQLTLTVPLPRARKVTAVVRPSPEAAEGTLTVTEA